jgi:copper transport protein
MTNRHFLIIPAMLLVFVCGPHTVFAHAKLLSSVPKAGESLALSPKALTLTFTTPIQREMSSLELVGSNGSSISLSQREVSADGKTLLAEVPELGPASYTVIWRVLSADDHLINGEFSFQIDAETGPQQTVEGTRSETDHSAMDHGAMDHGDEPVNRVSWPQSIVRWIIYIALMVLGGGLVFRIFILAGVRAPEGGDAYRSMNGMLLGAGAVLAVFLVLSLLQQTNVIFSSILPRNIYLVLSETNFGFAWTVQFGASVATLFITAFHWAKGRSHTTPWIWIALALWLAIPLGSSLSGHAKAASHEFSFAIVSDWLHMVAAAVWTGGVASIAILLPEMNRLRATTNVVHRFHRLAIAATAALVATGAYNSWIHVDGLSALLITSYGQVLLVKIMITVSMLALGAVNAFVLAPRLNDENNERLFLRSVRVEAALAVIVLLLAAILVYLPPAREHLPIPADGSLGSATTEQ